jgi:hypothetical protein
MKTLNAQLHDAYEAALSELSHVTLPQIQLSTALTWAGRALASYTLYAQTGDLHRLVDATEYHHEAVEHASGADARTCATIAAVLEDAKSRVIGSRGT